MKTREQIITDMCYTWRHDYGLTRIETDSPWGQLSSGLSDDERKILWAQMAKLFDVCISPHMVFANNDNFSVNRGCRVCGIGSKGEPLGYVCPRTDCPTRITCQD